MKSEFRPRRRRILIHFVKSSFLLGFETFLASPHQPKLLYIYGVKILKRNYIAFSNGESHLKGNRGVGERCLHRLLPPTVTKPRSLIAVKIPGITKIRICQWVD